MQMSTQASSSASGRQDAAVDFSKVINFGSAAQNGTLTQAMPLMLLALVGYWLVTRRKG
jgi:hypothetical protein